MDTGNTNVGSTMGEDAPEQPQCRMQTEVDDVQESRSPIVGDMASFTSVCLVFTLALVNRVVHELHNLQSTVAQMRSEIRSSDSLLFNSRKRRRDHWPTNVDLVHQYMELGKGLTLLHRQIHSPWYIKPRAMTWSNLFLDFVLEDDPQRFRDFFRMTPTLFHHICLVLHDSMVTKPPDGLCTLPNRQLLVQRQVAIAIRRLSTGDQVLGIGELFGVSASTVSKCTWKFVRAMNRKFDHLIKWHARIALEEVKASFLQKGFPNCCGAIDGPHFPIELPRGENSVNYFDYKHNISVSMQAVVDAKGRFTDICAGWPGSVQDSRLMRNSKFYHDVIFLKTKLANWSHVCANGTPLREYLLADAGYPLYDWLVVPFARGLDPNHDFWNNRHSSTKMVVKRSFSLLKTVWRILSRILWKPQLENIGPLIKCCCLLHNLMVDHREQISVLDPISTHPIGYASVLRPTREFYEGGPEARDQLFMDVMET